MNLAHEIIQGTKDVAAARQAYAQAMEQRRAGNPPEIMQKLMFDIPSGDTADPDQQVM